MVHRASLLLALSLATVACFVDSISPIGDGPASGGAGGSGASSGGTGPGGGGSAPLCSQASDCGVSSECVTFSCPAGSCVEDLAPVGAECETGKVCDGQGSCLLDLGASCDDGAECASAACADGVCCNAACDGPCDSCDPSGTCALLAAGAQVADCAPGVCDAAGACAIGTTDGAFSISSTGTIDAWTGAVDAANRVVMGGTFDGTATLAGSPLTSVGVDGWLARFNEAGNPSWGVRFGGPGSEEVTGVALAGDGTPYVSGWHNAGVTIGATPYPVSGGADGFIARLDPGTGAPLWSRALSGVGTETTNGIAVDPSGNVIVVGTFDLSVDLGAGTLTTAGGADLFVLKLDPDGQPLWSLRFGGLYNDRARDVAARPDGSIVIGGAAGGPMSIGATPLDDPSGEGAFVAVLSPSGAPLFADIISGFDDQLARFVAVDGDGNFALVGGLRGSATFGPAQLTSGGDVDVFAAVYNANFTRRWAKTFGDFSYQEAWGARFDANGNLLLAGDMDGNLDLGLGALTSAGGRDAFIAKLAPDGTPLYSRRFGDFALQWGNALGVGAAGEPFLIGSFDGTLDPGSGPPLSSTGGRDSYVIRLLP